MVQLVLEILIGVLIGFMTGFFLCLWLTKKYRVKKIVYKKTVTDIYTDYICAERLLMIRVFPQTYEKEASEGVTPNNILEFGMMGNMMYYLIQL